MSKFDISDRIDKLLIKDLNKYLATRAINYRCYQVERGMRVNRFMKKRVKDADDS